MNNQYKKLQNLKESNDAIFQEAFSFRRKQQPTQQGSGQVEKIGEGKYRMGNSIITKLRGTPEVVVLGYDFENSPLKWLLEATFEGSIKINLHTTPHSLEAFHGDWKSGVFKGDIFGSYSNFIGGQFGDERSKPKFFPEYTKWKTSPHYFFDGVIKDTKEGLLGLRNLPFGKIENSFNILSIAPGTMVTIELKDGIKHTIYCQYRFSSNSNTSSYKITNGKTKKTYDVVHDWHEMRGQSPTEFLKNTNINLKTANKLIGIFNLDISVGIKLASVSSAGTSGNIGSSFKSEKDSVKITPAELSKEQVSIELSSLPFLRINKIPRKGGSETALYFSFLNSSIKDEYNNIILLLNKGWINSYIKQIKLALDNEIIKGAPDNYNFLANLIGKDTNINISNLDKEIVNALNGIESFLKSFVNSMVRRVRKTGDEKGLYDVEDVVGKKIIKDRLKALFGKKEESQAAPKTKTTQTAKKPMGKIRIPESKNIRGIIQNILHENLKHF